MLFLHGGEPLAATAERTVSVEAVAGTDLRPADLEGGERIPP
jgi:hypothetical protein